MCIAAWAHSPLKQAPQFPPKPKQIITTGEMAQCPPNTKRLKGIAKPMKNQSHNPSEIDRFMAAALSIAEDQIRRQGFMIILYIMATPQGTRVVTGDAGTDFDDLSTIFRLSAAAEAARAGVVAYQVRTTLHQAGHEREGILVSAQTLGSLCRNWFHPILRKEGRFTGFAPKQAWPPGPTESPFTRLLPTSIPSAREREAAAKALAAMTTPIAPSLPANPHR